jgi:hypothetical protein
LLQADVPANPGRGRPGEPSAVTLQARSLVEVERDDDLVGQHGRLDLAAQPAERERDHRLAKIRRSGNVATARVIRHVNNKLLGHSHAHAERPL